MSSASRWISTSTRQSPPRKRSSQPWKKKVTQQQGSVTCAGVGTDFGVRRAECRRAPGRPPGSQHGRLTPPLGEILTGGRSDLDRRPPPPHHPYKPHRTDHDGGCHGEPGDQSEVFRIGDSRVPAHTVIDEVVEAVPGGNE